MSAETDATKAVITRVIAQVRAMLTEREADKAKIADLEKKLSDAAGIVADHNAIPTDLTAPLTQLASEIEAAGAGVEK